MAFPEYERTSLQQQHNNPNMQRTHYAEHPQFYPMQQEHIKAGHYMAHPEQV